ncbi:homocysteine S-methyltransferase 1 [[Candida] railenensis]|uniref:Homocysteine S-methyltransferase 1 n=1 Tax=[Candida] railenensis TaxID=45579 RepID=A0A9P0QTF4_9ASCO|nr:homocysteine S-methyltransferase 1 [[Candida] railenensis]
MASIKEALSQHQLVLDGALGTQLETKFSDTLKEKGLDIQQHPLWSALILLRQPELIQEIHYEYLKSGADIILTATYQASKRGLQQHANLTDEEVVNTYTKAVDIAAAAQDQFRVTNSRDTFVCASIGPYGGYLANGAEYTGDYSDLQDLSYLAEFHHDMVSVFLSDDRVSLIGFETIPNFEEAKQILNLMEKLYKEKNSSKEIGFYLSFNFKNEEQICDGTDLKEVMDYINDRVSNSDVLTSNLIGLGANCIKSQWADKIIANIAKHNALKIPLVVYPNAGLNYDLNTASYTVDGVQADVWRQALKSWTKNGVGIVGGCCGSGPGDITAIRESVQK